MKACVSLVDVGVRFRLYEEKAHTLKETLLHTLKGKRSYRDLWALKHVDLNITPGEALAILGRNGSGKSTLLKVLAGVYEPTQGTRSVHGSIASLIELGAGFNAELTGRENVYLSGAIMGMPRTHMHARYGAIVSFAELDDFMDTPVKNYSSGMFARLGFAIATDVDADLLLIDEVLSVGDEAFQRKSYARIERHLALGKTIVFVSHDAAAVERLCKTAVVLEHGELVFRGPTREALAHYREVLARPAGLALAGR